jgi:glycosyltransferase involved in cell wall biosynthesis
VNNAGPSVAILLCTLDGARFLPDQLDSINRQWHGNLRVWISDDGSKDNTLALLDGYQFGHDGLRAEVLSGPQSGHTANFLSLACNPDIDADYYAFADQDDIWEAEKLYRAVSMLEPLPLDSPALYCARTRAVTEDGRPVGLSPLFRRPPSFANALLQNIGGGNTMVMNRAARQLLLTAGNINVVSHDWWTYLLVSAAGGTVIYDPRPSLQYRQHTRNIVGSNRGLRARIRRTTRALQNRSRNWNTINIEALQTVQDLISPENRIILEEFSQARNELLIPRMRGIKKSGVYLQTVVGNTSLFVAKLLNKI